MREQENPKAWGPSGLYERPEPRTAALMRTQAVSLTPSPGISLYLPSSPSEPCGLRILFLSVYLLPSFTLLVGHFHCLVSTWPNMLPKFICPQFSLNSISQSKFLQEGRIGLGQVSLHLPYSYSPSIPNNFISDFSFIAMFSPLRKVKSSNFYIWGVI